MEELQKEMELLNSKLSGDMLKDMDLRDRIHEIEMQLNGVSAHCGLDKEDCENCGS